MTSSMVILVLVVWSCQALASHFLEEDAQQHWLSHTPFRMRGSSTITERLYSHQRRRSFTASDLWNGCFAEFSLPLRGFDRLVDGGRGDETVDGREGGETRGRATRGKREDTAATVCSTRLGGAFMNPGEGLCKTTPAFLSTAAPAALPPVPF